MYLPFLQSAPITKSAMGNSSYVSGNEHQLSFSVWYTLSQQRRYGHIDLSEVRDFLFGYDLVKTYVLGSTLVSVHSYDPFDPL